jgi:hypothetical protein
MKRFITHSVLLLLLMGVHNTVFAATTYPYSPSEALDNFDTTYRSQYDTINADLQMVSKKATAWSSTAVLQTFQIAWADDSQNGYAFQFIDVNNPLKALRFAPTLGNGFVLSESEIDRTPEMKYGIYRAPMRLRDLVPAMKNDKKLLPLLDSLVAEDCDTIIGISLQKTITDRLVWHIEFRSQPRTDTASCNNYLVSTSAGTTTDPFFSVRLLK